MTEEDFSQIPKEFLEAETNRILTEEGWIRYGVFFDSDNSVRKCDYVKVITYQTPLEEGHVFLAPNDMIVLEKERLAEIGWSFLTSGNAMHPNGSNMAKKGTSMIRITFS